MIIVLERTIRDQDKSHIREFLVSRGYTIREIVGEEETILGAVGVKGIDVREVELLPGVARVIPITSPYKLASREFRKDDTVISLGTASAHPRAHRRAAHRGDRRALRRGVPAADPGVRRLRAGERRRALPRRRVEAAHLPVRLPGARRGGDWRT